MNSNEVREESNKEIKNSNEVLENTYELRFVKVTLHLY